MNRLPYAEEGANHRYVNGRSPAVPLDQTLAAMETLKVPNPCAGFDADESSA
jgi:hypothetical protein